MCPHVYTIIAKKVYTRKSYTKWTMPRLIKSLYTLYARRKTMTAGIVSPKQAPSPRGHHRHIHNAHWRMGSWPQFLVYSASATRLEEDTRSQFFKVLIGTFAPRHQFIYESVWNRLSSSIVTTPSVNSFQHYLYSAWINLFPEAMRVLLLSLWPPSDPRLHPYYNTLKLSFFSIKHNYINDITVPYFHMPYANFCIKAVNYNCFFHITIMLNNKGHLW